VKIKFGPIRDVVLLIGGLGLLANEALIVTEPRALIITVAVAMIGLPATLLADRKFVGSSPSAEPTTGPAADEATPK
jgi:hypothetical protein